MPQSGVRSCVRVLRVCGLVLELDASGPVRACVLSEVEICKHSVGWFRDRYQIRNMSYPTQLSERLAQLCRAPGRSSGRE